MSSSETILVVMSALALVGFAVVGVAGWVVTSSLQGEAGRLDLRADRMEQKVDEHAMTLSSVSSELHHARADIAQLRELMTTVRGELESVAHGPLSLRTPPSGPIDQERR